VNRFQQNRRRDLYNCNVETGIRSVALHFRSGNERRVVADLISAVRTDFAPPLNLNPTVAKWRDRAVLFWVEGETGRVIRRDCKDLQRSRQPSYAPACPYDAPISVQTLARLSDSLGLG